jgi:hypothetical protein
MSRPGGCLYCGTGTGVCGQHARQIADAVKREGYGPQSRDQLAKGGRR